VHTWDGVGWRIWGWLTPTDSSAAWFLHTASVPCSSARRLYTHIRVHRHALHCTLIHCYEKLTVRQPCGNVRSLGPYNWAGSGIDFIGYVPRYCCLGEVYHAFTCWADLVSRQRWMGSVASSHMMQSSVLPAWSDVAFGTHRNLSRCSDAIVLFWVDQLREVFPVWLSYFRWLLLLC